MFCRETVLRKDGFVKTIVLGRGSPFQEDEFYVSILTGPDVPQPRAPLSREAAEMEFDNQVSEALNNGWQIDLSQSNR
jgi:hypothetical protein